MSHAGIAYMRLTPPSLHSLSPPLARRSGFHCSWSGAVPPNAASPTEMARNSRISDEADRTEVPVDRSHGRSSKVAADAGVSAPPARADGPREGKQQTCSVRHLRQIRFVRSVSNACFRLQLQSGTDALFWGLLL